MNNMSSKKLRTDFSQASQIEVRSEIKIWNEHNLNSVGKNESEESLGYVQ